MSFLSALPVYVIKNSNFHRYLKRSSSSIGNIVIGDISKDLNESKSKHYVPRKYVKLKNGELDLTQNQLSHLRWMLQKDLLGQDVFLIGAPGSFRRDIAMQFLELTQREVEYVALSRDTTESDLKQRREIQGSTAQYFDQSAVRAAIEGRILILEGIEKAERNVLPVLNNLLENREMHLEDGRFLIPAHRYYKLLKEHGEENIKRWGLECVHDQFRIIALGLPVPYYPGNALDPPLRSRFQARHISPYSYKELLSIVSSETKADSDKLKKLVTAACTLSNLSSPHDEDLAKTPFKLDILNLPDFPLDSVPFAAKMLENNPQMSVFQALYAFYPYETFLNQDSIKNLEKVFDALDIKEIDSDQVNSKMLKSMEKTVKSNEKHKMKISIKSSSDQISFVAPIGELSSSSEIYNADFIENDYQSRVLLDIMQAHAVSDICIIGPKGCGKNKIAEALARIFNYRVETMTLYRDMSARDLLQQRVTAEDESGNTGWKPSPLVKAAQEGHLLILDGIHRLHPSTLCVLHRLIQNRELQLYDGTRLLRKDRYDDLIQEGFTIEQLSELGVFSIHPTFRIVALAEPPSISQKNHWLTSEVLCLFSFHTLRNFTQSEEKYIINEKFGKISKSLSSVIDLAHVLRTSKDGTLNNLSSSLSTRQLLRIANKLTNYPNTSSYDIVQHAFLSKFLPNIAKHALENVCMKCSITSERNESFFSKKSASKDIKCTIENGILKIGSTSIPVYKTESLTKVPDILFYDVPQHIQLLEHLLQDFILGNNLLLVGNQGVGKNKIADRLLQLMNRPREYLQLHRDTTVHSLTVQPTVKNGMVIYEDSPLVKAVKNGHVLVIDEADKAPVHVTCILKSLVETGEMILSDGKRIVPEEASKNFKTTDELIILHKDFRMIVLANRPGFPFLGNDFFAALGDLFSCHAIDNPSIESELKLLENYGPNVPKNTVNKIVKAFSTLRAMADQGMVTYPYSTREVVNIIKHLEKYPEDDLANAISNVFDFDRYTSEITNTLLEVLESSGLPTKGVVVGKKVAKPIQVTINRKSGLDVSGPKHGKIDPKGDPHVGGNTWAGGTGGRDTAGLGGKGGPYRLDAGHPVHQLSDEEKDDVPEHIKQAAREMNRRAFEERLKEIKMSQYDAKLYGQFLDAVQTQIGALRGVLSALQARTIERQWARHQTSGDLDETKIIEGLTGEQSIFKRRVEQTPLPGTPLNRPKRLRLLTDVSGSMYRFNSFDGRLDRSMEAAVLVMEALKGYESQLQYDIWGHSGESDNLQFVPIDHPPKNEKERLQVIRNMHAHSQFCWAGDNTVPAVAKSMMQMAADFGEPDSSKWDEAMLVILSDANLSRYGIPASHLAAALTCQNNINAYIIFIGSLGDQAERLLKELPMGRAFTCMDVSNLPKILQQVFASSIARNNDS